MLPFLYYKIDFVLQASGHITDTTYYKNVMFAVR